MKILAVSDVEADMIYSPLIKQRFNDVDLILGCGDLPHYYLEYIISMLNRPLYYVRGNHASRSPELGSGGERTHPWGGMDVHRRVVRDASGLLLAGLEGSLAYNYGVYQYSQEAMWLMVIGLVPALLRNRLLYGRYLDVFISHAPPWHIHDKEDLPHQGFKAFRWLMKVFRPAFFLHGHIHIYQQYEVTETQVQTTRVMNAYRYKTLEFDLLPGRGGIQHAKA